MRWLTERKMTERKEEGEIIRVKNRKKAMKGKK